MTLFCWGLRTTKVIVYELRNSRIHRGFSSNTRTKCPLYRTNLTRKNKNKNSKYGLLSKIYQLDLIFSVYSYSRPIPDLIHGLYLLLYVKFSSQHVSSGTTLTIVLNSLSKVLLVMHSIFSLLYHR